MLKTLCKLFLKIQQHPLQLKTIPQLEDGHLQVTKNTLVDYCVWLKPNVLLDEHDYAPKKTQTMKIRG